MKPINILKKLNESSSSGNHKMNMIKYNTKGYTEATGGYYKGKPIVDYREKDFKKGTSVLTPFECGYCYTEFYVKSNIHDFFKQGDFDDPYEVPKESMYCPKCKRNDDLNYNGEVLIKEPGAINEDTDTDNVKVYACLDCCKDFEITNNEWPYGEGNCPYCLSGDVSCCEDDLDESEDFTDTSEYYGGTYPSPPDSYWEEPEHKPSKEEIDDYNADAAYEESKLNEGFEETSKYLFNKYRTEFDTVNEVYDISDYLNKLYDEGGMEAVDDWFLPGASKEYKDDFKKLISKKNNTN